MKKTKTYPYDEIKSLLPKLPHKMQVSFALYCAKDVFHLVRDKDRTVVKDCLDTVELWLKSKATAEECNATADATFALGDTYAAVDAANAARAASYSAYFAADTAAYTACAATDATSTANYDKAIKKYLNHLNKMIKDLTPIEKVLFDIN